MRLLVRHPTVAFRDCRHCLLYDYDEETGKPKQDARCGGFVPRLVIAGPKGAKFRAPCRSGVGCPKGTPEEPRTLSNRNLRAYLFHLQCAAVQRWPADAIVERNAAIIAPIIAAQEREEEQRLMLSLLKASVRR